MRVNSKRSWNNRPVYQDEWLLYLHGKDFEFNRIEFKASHMSALTKRTPGELYSYHKA